MDAIALARPRGLRLPASGDLLVPGLVATLSLVDVWVPLGFVTHESDRAVLTVVFVACSLALVWRRQAPLLVLGLIVACESLLYLAIGAPEALGTFLPPLVAIYALGRYGDPRALVLAAPIAVLGTALHEIEDPQFQLSGPAIFFWVLLAAAWPVGRAFRLRAEAVDTLSRRAEQLRERRDADARAAVAAERERIARELHDVVGHGLSVIVLQLVAADGMLDGGDAPAARQRLGAAERSARQSLAEMRRLLGLLDEQDASLTPQPGITDLPQLVEETRAAGVDVELEVAGRPVELSAGVELTAYRVVQEALTNVIKHARPPRARVRLTYAPGELTVEVVDDGAAVTGPRDSGRGIAGMRERVALYDGDLSVGPRAEGGFAVRAQLPVVE